jgi:branched-chain amino acid transport system substrate-binding protein
MKRLLIGTVSSLALGLPSMAVAQDSIKIGLLVTQEGTFAEGGTDGIRGFELALAKYGNEINGIPIEWVLGPSDATPDTAVRQARRLIEQDEVDFIIGPLSGSEGIALRDYAKTIPDKTIINGASGALETTFVDPAPNFFRFHTNGLQWGAGLGRYAVEEKGWTRVATVAADYSFGHTNFMGFAIDFCMAGGDIVERFWVPLGATDFGGVIAALPDDVDAIYLGVGGTDAINFMNQYEQAGADSNFLGGSILADQTVLTARGRAKDALVGTPTSGPFSDDNPDEAWQEFVADYREMFPDGFTTPSIFGVLYHVSTLGVLQALEEVGGDLSDGQVAFREAMSNLELQSPLGVITLDENRQAIGPVFVNEVVEQEDGTLRNTMVGRTDGVAQSMGLSAEEFAALGMPGRDTPDCDALAGR